MTAKFASFQEYRTSVVMLTWPTGQATISALSTPTMSTDVLVLINAASRTETQSALQTLATKVNELSTIINNMRPA